MKDEDYRKAKDIYAEQKYVSKIICDIRNYDLFYDKSYVDGVLVKTLKIEYKDITEALSLININLNIKFDEI